MITIQTIEDVYPALDELIVELISTDQKHLATILHHRIYHVPWTTSSELFQELQDILGKALKSHEVKLPEQLEKQINRLILVIHKYLDNME